LCFVIPGATIQTIADILKPNGLDAYRQYLEEVDQTCRDYFETSFTPRSQSTNVTKEALQGCSTLSTDAPLGHGIEPGESGGVSVLAERSGLIAAQDLVAEAAYPGEASWVVTDAGLVLLEGDVAGVVQLVLDVPMASDGGCRVACRYGRNRGGGCHP